jgi:hypothetical protein
MVAGRRARYRLARESEVEGHFGRLPATRHRSRKERVTDCFHC